MAGVDDYRCPNCHAALPVAPGAAAVACAYCGTQVLLRKPAVDPAQVVARVAPRVGLLVGIVMGVVLMIFASVISLVVCVARKSSTITFHGGTTTTTTTTTLDPLEIALDQGGQKITIRGNQVVIDGMTLPLGGPPVATRPSGSPPAAERVMWWSEGGLALARVDADALDDLILLARYYDGESNQLHLVAIDGATGRRLWRTPSYGDIAVGATLSGTHFGVQGAHIVVTDTRAVAHVLDLATGDEQRSVRLTDVADWVCPDPRDPDRCLSAPSW